MYAPKVNAYVRLFDGRLIDISDYVIRGKVNRKINQISTAEVELRNPHKMWSQPNPKIRKQIDPDLTWPFFHPMDPITIYLTRRPGFPVQVFTGYLDEVPYIDLYPHTVTLKASCTLKRLQFTQWDPSLPYSHSFLQANGWTLTGSGGIQNQGFMNPPLGGPEAQEGLAPPPDKNKVNDSSFKQLMVNSLIFIGGWKHDDIYVESLPSKLLDKATALFTAISKPVEDSYKEFEQYVLKMIGPGAGGGGAFSGHIPHTAHCGFDAEQATNADIIAGVLESRGANRNVITAALMAAAQESSLRNIAGGDRDSVGLFQMRPSQGWGSFEQVHDPVYASNKWFDVAMGVGGHDTMDPGALAQAVERSGFPGAYAKWRGGVDCLLDSATPGDPGAAPNPGTPGPAPNAPPPGNAMGTGDCAGCNQAICDLGKQLKSQGWNVTEAPCFGGVHPVHVANSEHYKGDAIDVSVPAPGKSKADGDKLQQDSMAHGFNTIWQGVQRAQGHPDDPSVGDHFDHVHIDNRYGTGNAGGAGAGGGGGDPNAYVRAAAFASILNLPGVDTTLLTTTLQGEKALLINQSLFPFIQQLCSGSLRSFMSLPDGKFYAFYPDYFGSFSDLEPAYWDIDDLEIVDGKITLSDLPLATHVFIIGDLLGFALSGQTDDAAKAAEYQATTGVASIMNALMSDWLNLKPEDIDPQAAKNLEAKPPGSGADQPLPNLFTKDMALRFLNRYGARPYVQEQPQIRSAFIELVYAVRTFQLMWSQQFSTNFEFTFMPELYPGGICRFVGDVQNPSASHGFQCFVEEVTHTFDFEAGFSTYANLTAPSVMRNNPAGVDALTVGMIKAGVMDATSPDNGQAKQDFVAAETGDPAGAPGGSKAPGDTALPPITPENS